MEINAATQRFLSRCSTGARALDGVGISEPFTGDTLKHAIVFPEKRDLATLVNRAVCLRFHLRDAELFAFAFRAGD